LESLPEDVRLLLLLVGDYEELEVLLRLVRAPERAWTEAELAAETTAEVGRAMERLVAAGLAEFLDDDTRIVRYRPASGELDRKVRLLAGVYAENPLSVIRFMTTTSIERLRTSAARAFADAFLLRRPKKDG